MSDYIGSLDNYYAAGAASVRAAGADGRDAAKKSGADLDMMDFLSLMVAQFQNQSIDNTASTSDMLNQLVQMSMIQAITNITDATVMMYSGSLVGKEVTIGQYSNDGKLEEIVGTVTGTGVVGGQQVVFVDGKSYYLSEIMAIGRLPEIEKPEEGGGKPEGGGEGTEEPSQTPKT